LDGLNRTLPLAAIAVRVASEVVRPLAAFVWTLRASMPPTIAVP